MKSKSPPTKSPIGALAIACIVSAAGISTISVRQADAQQVIENSVNATLLANRAKSLVRQHSSTTSPLSQSDRTRSTRGSQVANRGTKVHCGGVAIGNVQTHPGDHHAHSTTVFVHGSIINTGNSC